mmetsp:Transcript_2797/g.6300  ORF Transcript_2797/g.6300 Transcript_2797/m.6300 type:complete len:229 (-) Transcript_2797:667-1353(-)
MGHQILPRLLFDVLHAEHQPPLSGTSRNASIANGDEFDVDTLARSHSRIAGLFDADLGDVGQMDHARNFLGGAGAGEVNFNHHTKVEDSLDSPREDLIQFQFLLLVIRASSLLLLGHPSGQIGFGSYTGLLRVRCCITGSFLLSHPRRQIGLRTFSRINGYFVIFANLIVGILIIVQSSFVSGSCMHIKIRIIFALVVFVKSFLQGYRPRQILPHQSGKLTLHFIPAF